MPDEQKATATNNPATIQGKAILTDAIIIAAVPGLGYAYAFLYEAGYCDYYNIPFQLISISLSHVLIASSVLLGAIILIWPILDTVFVPYLMKGSPTFLKKKIKRVIVMVFLLCFIPFFTHADKKLWIPVISILAFYAFGEFIWPLITQRGIKGYEAKLAAQENLELKVITVTDLMAQKAGKSYLLIVLILFGLGWLAFNAGLDKARRQEEFLVARFMDKDMAVLRIYDTHLIAAAFDSKTKEVERTFHVIRLETKETIAIEFRLRSIGPLTLED